MHVGMSPFGGIDAALDEFVDAFMREVDPDLEGGRHPVYADDFVAWCEEVAKKDLEDYQQDIGLSVVDNPLTAVPSCHGAGKSFLAALIIVWWLTTRENAFVVWTAPRWKQVRAVVGRYVKALLKELDTGLTLLETMEIKASGGELVGMGVSPADNDDNGINGIHADNVLIVVDEADGVKRNVWAGVRSFMSTASCRLLAIGNPIVPGSYFHKLLTDPRLGYHIIRIDGLRLPTMSRSAVAPFPELAALMEAEGIPYADEKRAKIAAKKGITGPDLWHSWLLEWGTSNPYWASKVRGIHPQASRRQMFTQAMLEKAWENHIDPKHGDPRCYGFDIAEEGGNETVGYLWHGGKARLVYAARGGDTPGVNATRAIKKHVEKFQRIAIDANGVGRGVYENLTSSGYRAINHKGSHKARQPHVYANRKSELFYGLQKDMQEGLVDLDPDDVILAGQLLSVWWKHADKLTVETRSDRERRGADEEGESPDRADALSIARGYAVGGTTKPKASKPKASSQHEAGSAAAWDQGAGVMNLEM